MYVCKNILLDKENIFFSHKYSITFLFINIYLPCHTQISSFLIFFKYNNRKCTSNYDNSNNIIISKYYIFEPGAFYIC